MMNDWPVSFSDDNFIKIPELKWYQIKVGYKLIIVP
jgi:hypothetical protein